jgi:hypothetical protein
MGVKKKCSKCGKANDRLPQRYCKSCHAANMRRTRPKHSELNDEQRKKATTRAYSKVLLQRGVLKREACEVCSSEKTEMHHDDYNKPKEVRWFCRKHHLMHHKWLDLIKRLKPNNQNGIVVNPNQRHDSVYVKSNVSRATLKFHKKENESKADIR